MRILIVKTSSLGDVIHNLPVVSDIKRHFPYAVVDWCVEESFAAIPRLHQGVDQIIPVALRRWRKALFKASTWREIATFRTRLQTNTYDLIIDTQGLLKSALLARQACGPVAGYAAASAREPIAARFYDRHFKVSTTAHAVHRNRLLTAAAMAYQIDDAPDYGVTVSPADFDWLPAQPYVVLLTATSRDDKLWPEAHWLNLGEHLAALGFAAVLPGGNPVERERAARLAAGIPRAKAAPTMSIQQLAALLAGSRAVVGLDTGLTHLAVALNVPTVAIYTATDPGLTGVLGAGFFRNLGGKAQIPAPAVVLAELQTAIG
jgi:heptosyltransferase I